MPAITWLHLLSSPMWLTAYNSPYNILETILEMKKIIIAIDGYSSCGKSTMARTLARNIGYIYIDTGAMYRAVALYCLENNLVSPDGSINEAALRHAMQGIDIAFTTDPGTGGIITHLNGKNVEKEIRSLEVSQHVSAAASLPFVREALTQQQRKMGEQKGVVMDGRDIGTTVFPHAELKIFVTASAEVRARRRYNEMLAKGEQADYNAILSNVERRDYLDTHREVSPLVKAPDAITLDNSTMTIQEQNAWLMQRFEEATAE